MTHSQPLAKPIIAIIGSGFGGLGMGYYLKQAGIHSFTIFEKSQGLGGVWRENTYPGAACDVASHLYSFSFEPNYPWQSRYGKQAEILSYQQHVSRKYALQSHMRFGAQLQSATFDDARSLWCLEFADGSRFEAHILITAMGQLHRPQLPKIAGLDRFKGPAFHSATWQHSVDLSGKTVGVIGSGASAVQFVPAIAPKVANLKLFQRSNSWVLPKSDRRYSAAEMWLFRKLPQLQVLDRLRIFWTYELLASALQPNRWLSKPTGVAMRAASRLMARRQVRDPKLRAQLAPDGPLGCKRMLLTNEWLPALARKNVDVISTAITEVTERGLITADGQEHAVDVLIYGTGFAATEFLAPVQVTGRDGKTLQQAWAQGAEAYLGMTVAGFPNLFMLYGPNTNLGAGSIIFMLERQQRYLVALINHLQARGAKQIEPDPAVQAAYNQQLVEKGKHSPFKGGCHSWYINAQGRNTNNWLGWMSEFALRVKAPNLQHFLIRN